MVAVAQLVRALGCGPSGCAFKSRQPPHEPRWVHGCVPYAVRNSTNTQRTKFENLCVTMYMF